MKREEVVVMVRVELGGATSTRRKQERVRRLVAEGGRRSTEAKKDGARSGGPRF